MDTSTLRRRLGGTVFAVAVAAGLVGLAAPAAVAAPVAAGPARVVVVDNGDAGTTVKATRGSLIVVSLAATGPRFAWSAPVSEDRGVVAPVFSVAGTDGGAIGLFSARRAGTTTISAVSACRPTGQICPFAAILFRVTIHVA